ncbi:MAG: metallophosphoesterase [Saprospiraceae bacterium]|nr:metallophosphoesterase [Pyrinomonadaceae bacterium]
MRRFFNVLLATALVFCIRPILIAQTTAAAQSPAGPLLSLPLRDASIRFLVIGDTGRGNSEQYELGRVMFNYHSLFRYDSVLMTGDNIYGKETADDMKKKFEDAYRPILDAGVKFYAALGNHDESNQRFYEYFNMKGEEYYRFEKNGVAFYSLNSNYMDKRQIDWMETEFAKDKSKWKIVFLHHPPYSSGEKHGSADSIRETVEPIFLKHGVDVVFAGHEHFYERIKPQKGIYYFISGAGGQIRKGNVKERSPLTEKAFDSDLSFMLVEITGDEMHYQVISRASATVDSGMITRTN